MLIADSANECLTNMLSLKTIMDSGDCKTDTASLTEIFEDMDNVFQRLKNISLQALRVGKFQEMIEKQKIGTTKTV